MLPQIIWLSFVLLSIGLELGQDGQPKHPSNHDFWGTLIVLTGLTALLYWGGFFNPFFVK